MDWNDRYRTESYLFGTEPTRALHRASKWFKKPSTCLCVADGEGRNSVWLAEQGHDVTAWDASSVAIEKAQRLADQRHVDVNYYTADASDYDWGAKSYDLVVAVFIQFAGPQLRKQIFEGMKVALKPGGIIFLHGYTPRQLRYGTGGPSTIDNLYTKPVLESAFKDFEVLRLESYEAEISEGSGHVGRSALIDLIARKPQGAHGGTKTGS